MSGFLNKVQLIGNLGGDPEVRTTRDGKQVVTLSVATSESWRDPHSGERRQRTEWSRVVIWNEGLGKIAEQYLSKGAKVYVEGKLTTNKWTDSNGVDCYSTEVHLTPYNGTLTFLDNKPDEGRAAGGDRRTAAAERRPTMAGAGSDLDGRGAVLGARRACPVTPRAAPGRAAPLPPDTRDIYDRHLRRGGCGCFRSPCHGRHRPSRACWRRR